MPKVTTAYQTARNTYEDACTSCLAPIWWLKNDTTKRSAPIDRTPSPDGNIIIVGNGDEYHVIVQTDRVPDVLTRYTNHFATCPHARAHKTSDTTPR